ncbi:hypothetical protein WA026_002568 [Henosepilachna vigintioctopunctata]|uniref:RNA-directed DNA polymerase n=1 Tax=Henosepilachna vigintioctopunctata TaxID=420089 RepID=A0AAW1TRU5_9CUCU
MDLVKKYGLMYDNVSGILKIGNEEFIPKYCSNQGQVGLKTIQAYKIPACSEQIIYVQPESNPEWCVGLIEPKRDNEFLTARTLSTVKREIPMRIANISNKQLDIQKGKPIATLEPVSWIVRCEEPSSLEKPKKKYVDLSKFELSWEHLSPEQTKLAQEFVLEENDLFDDHELEGTDLVSHRIDTGNAYPIRQAPRRLPLAKQGEVAELIESMKEKGVIEESSSPWSAPVVLVKKKDGTTRFCVDYRKLNDVTKKDSYPLPRIDDTLTTLAGSKWFSTLDLKSGYWQVKIHPDDREKTAFSTGSGLYQFNVMPFGLCNAPATFERLMEMILKGLTWKTCLVYLDDVMVMGSSFEDHLKNLKEIFCRFRNAHLKLNYKKCCLFQNEVKFLGHTISPAGIHTSEDKIKAVRDWPRPKDKHDVRSFLGLCTYYRRFVDKFADIAKPLHTLTENKINFSWTRECEAAFCQLKAALCSSPILSYPHTSGLFILDTDASNRGIGSVLSQVQDGEERVIEYFSKTFNKSERNYCVTRKELLALIKSVEHFHKYLYGRKFLIRTDHAALKWLLQMKIPEGQIARWIERLQQYDFEVEHRRGKIHNNADALSRRPCKEACDHCKRVEKKEGIVNLRRTTIELRQGWSTEELIEAQEADPDVKLLREWKRDNRRPTWKDISTMGSITKALWAQWDSLVIENGLLKRKWESTDGREVKTLLVVPRDKVEELLKEMHGGTSGAHFGVNKTIARIREKFYWVYCRDDVEAWCRKCTTCAATKGPPKKTHGKMEKYNVGLPFERIAVDVAGPFPTTNDGNKYILVAMDYFSKWPEAYALPNQETQTIARTLVDQFISRYGVPLELHSDQGRNFESDVFKKVMEILNIRKTRTTPLHPQSDGMVERFNRTMEQYLSKVVADHQKDWDKHLPVLLMAYRGSVHDTTGHTPAKVLFGRELRLPCDLLFGSPEEVRLEVGTYADELRLHLNQIHELVRDKIEASTDRMKTRYDLKANSVGFKEGDLVWLYNPQRKKGISPKLTQAWEGAYKVMKRINDVVYRIQRTPRSKPKVVHLDRLAKYYEGSLVENCDVDRDDQN